jgi:glutathione gamma-glutamylcysteinyltransferase
MEGYFALSEQFHTQSEPAFCGLGTLTMSLNALNLDPMRTWRGPWRWFSEELLDCCVPLDQVRKVGITFDEFVCLARCNGAATDAHRASESDLASFRQRVQAASSSGDAVLVVSYSRAGLGQTGSGAAPQPDRQRAPACLTRRAGHFSPIGGYHRARDLVLIMDVARFKYPPHWVPLPLLWCARPSPPLRLVGC